MSMIDLVLEKKDMLHYWQNRRIVREMGPRLSDHHAVMCKVRLVGTWIRRREGMNWAGNIRSEKLRELLYIEKYGRFLKGKRLKLHEGRNVEQIWEQMK